MTPKRIIQSGDPQPELTPSAKETDFILLEMSQLYRERVRAINGNDPLALKLVNAQISELKTKLARL